MGFEFNQVGRLTPRKFDEFYQIYKDTFDLEQQIKYNKTTYKGLEEKKLKNEEWL